MSREKKLEKKVIASIPVKCGDISGVVQSFSDGKTGVLCPGFDTTKGLCVRNSYWDFRGGDGRKCYYNYDKRCSYLVK